MIALIIIASILVYAAGVVVTGWHMGEFINDRPIGFLCGVFWPVVYPFMGLYMLQLRLEDWNEDRKARKKFNVPPARVVK